jgi:CHAD domain-containing protein
MHSLRDPADAVCRAIALELLAALTERHAELSGKEDVEALHDFRVAMRRLRSWLRAFEPQLPPMPRKARRRLRRIARVSNAGRDLQVQIAWLRARRSELSVRQRHGQDWLIARLENQLNKEGARFRARLEKDMQRIHTSLDSALQRASRALADAPPPAQGAPVPLDDTPFAAALALVVRDQADRIRDRLQAVQTPADHRQAHRARIEGKRLRYVLEPVADMIDANDALARLRRMQDSLGALQDSQTLSAAIAASLPAAARARGRRLAKLVRERGLSDRRLRDEERQDVEPGLLALARRAHTRAQDAFAQVEQRCLGANIETLVSAANRIADDLEQPASAIAYPAVTPMRTDDVSLR